MATRMTRAEYEATYGSKPVVSSSSIDTTPAPIRMTKAEYNAKYRPQAQSFIQSAKTDLREGFEAAKESFNQGADEFGGIERRVQSGETSKGMGLYQKFGEGLLASGGALFNTAFGAVKAALPDRAEKRVGETLGEDIREAFSPESREQFLQSLEQSEGGIFVPSSVDKKTGQQLREVGELYRTDENFRSTVRAAGGILEWLSLPGATKKVATQATEAATAAGNQINVAPLVKKITTPSDVKLESRRISQIADLEEKYSSLRKNLEFEGPGVNESRARIARSNVLQGIVDDDGLIRTKGAGRAADQYRKATIEGVEDVVKRNLEREGKTVSLPEVGKFLKLEVAKSGLEGADLVTALKGVEKELKGLALRSDTLDQINLAKLQDAKISTTRNINFNTPPETKTYRKAVARGYKSLIEKKSDFNVKEVNQELAKFYKDIERIEALDGKRVKGGRLGKYFAQISGNLIGGGAGSAVGGPLGMAIGTVVGGEAASIIAGKNMARTFGKGGVLPEKNAVLAAARKEANLPEGRSLDTPDPKIGIPAATKTKINELATPEQKKELASLQNQMSKNIESQKKAIKAKDYTLVSSLKEVYDSLVTSMKELVAEIIESVKKPNIGLSIRKSVTPEGVAKKMDFEDFQDVTTFLDDPQAALLSDKLMRMVDEMGIGKADLDTQTKFLQEVTDEADRMGLIQSNNLGKRNTQYSMQSMNTNSDITSDNTSSFNGSQDLPVDNRPSFGLSTQDRGAFGKGAEQVFNGFEDLTTKVLNDLQGKSTVSRQFISDLTNKPALKQPERDLIRAVLDDMDGNKVNVQEFADKVKARLLPLERNTTGSIDEEISGFSDPRYENITLPDELRGNVADYRENVYESPIANSSGSVHFSTERVPNYFAHTRIEDMADGKTRRVIEAQSDLFQKGRLETAIADRGSVTSYGQDEIDLISDRIFDGAKADELIPVAQNSNLTKDSFVSLRDDFADEPDKLAVIDEMLDALPDTNAIQQLSPYRNTWWERIVREEVKQAAADGKTKLQFPTGETAMKIEGLADNTDWTIKRGERNYDDTKTINSTSKLKVGDIINDNPFTDSPEINDKIVVEIIDDKQFKTLDIKPDRISIQSAEEFAEDGYELNELIKVGENKYVINDTDLELRNLGGVDTSNPIYRFYEKDVQKYLNKNYNAKVVTDENGVQWIEFDVPKDAKKLPVEAFGVTLALSGAAYAGQDE